MSKTILKVNASSLVLSRCILSWYRTIVQGYKPPAVGAKLVYGIACHKFNDVMFKTDGRLDLARDAALRSFNMPKYDDRKSQHISDANHMMVTCLNYWSDYIKKDTDFEVLMLRSKCWWCDGSGFNEADLPDTKTACKYCAGEGYRMQPATEVTFSIPYYEDDNFIILLEGTIDKIGKIRNGCYAIGDYKYTSSYDARGYLDDYDMSSPLRFYLLSLKLMSKLHPESILGQLGATRIGAFIDGIFLKPKAIDNSYARSDVFQWPDKIFDDYRVSLDRALERLMRAIRDNNWQVKEGVLNGTCENKNKYSKCEFWLPCKTHNPVVEEMLLKRDFVQKTYDPLHHNE